MTSKLHYLGCSSKASLAHGLVQQTGLSQEVGTDVSVGGRAGAMAAKHRVGGI